MEVQVQDCQDGAALYQKFRKSKQKLEQGSGGFTCVFCNKHFKRSTDEEVHIRRHIRERPFECGLCSFSASCLTDVMTHQSRTHATFHVPCIDFGCHKIFKSEFARKRHHKLNHTHEIPLKFICDICDKGFKLQGNLIAHRRHHTGEKPFECTVCKRTFTQKSTLNTHMRVHTGEKRFQCQKCKKWFATKQYWQTHQSKVKCEPPPKPFKCKICGVEFIQNSHLKDHRKLAHGPQAKTKQKDDDNKSPQTKQPPKKACPPPNQQGPSLGTKVTQTVKTFPGKPYAIIITKGHPY